MGNDRAGLIDDAPATKGDTAALRADISALKTVMKGEIAGLKVALLRAFVLQAVVIVAMTVTLVKLLPGGN